MYAFTTGMIDIMSTLRKTHDENGRFIVDLPTKVIKIWILRSYVSTQEGNTMHHSMNDEVV